MQTTAQLKEQIKKRDDRLAMMIESIGGAQKISRPCTFGRYFFDLDLERAHAEKLAVMAKGGIHNA